MSEEADQWDDPDALSDGSKDESGTEFGGVIVLGLFLTTFAYLVYGQSVALARLALFITGGLAALSIIAATILAWGRQ